MTLRREPSESQPLGLSEQSPVSDGKFHRVHSVNLWLCQKFEIVIFRFTSLVDPIPPQFPYISFLILVKCFPSFCGPGSQSWERAWSKDWDGSTLVAGNPSEKETAVELESGTSRAWGIPQTLDFSTQNTPIGHVSWLTLWISKVGKWLLRQFPSASQLLESALVAPPSDVAKPARGAGNFDPCPLRQGMNSG